MSIPYLDLFQKNWGPAQPWWGPGLDRRPLEIDMVAESLDGCAWLLGLVKSGRSWKGKRDCFPIPRDGDWNCVCLFRSPKRAILGPSKCWEDSAKCVRGKVLVFGNMFSIS